MKVLPFTSEADFNKNEHEISKLQKNQHKNVVGFVEAIEGDTAHFVVLELCSCSLADRMSEGQKLGTLMDRVKVFRIVQDVLAGLGFLHSRNEVYGDVKPSNILIGADGTAKLGDFGGVAGVGTQKTWNAAECGTMQFWGPEMFVLGGNVGSVSQAGDMWAFGLIVLELLTGKAWISGQNAVEIAESVKGFDVQAVCRPATIANTAEPLLCFLLSKNPLERLSSAELIRSGRLRSILGEETPLSRFIREELDSTERTVEQLLERLSERDNTIAQLEREKAQMQQIIEQQATTIAQQRVHDTVYVDNLAGTVTKKDLQVFFEPISADAECTVIFDSRGNSRGFGFAKFVSEELAQKAVDEMNGKELKGRPLNVSIALSKTELKKQRQLKEETKWRNLLVSNLPLEMTDEEFRTLFESFGPVTSSQIVRSEDGTSRGFGFCLFEKDEDARQCILKLSETEIQGRRLQINFVQSDRKRAPRTQPPMGARVYGQGMQIPSLYPQGMMMWGMSSGVPSVGQMGMPGLLQMPMNYMPPMGMGQMGMGMPIGAPQFRPSNLPTGFNMDEFREMADEDKQQYVGEFIYTKVEEVDAERAGQITGMLLELGLQEGFALLQDDAALAQKIREAQGVIQGELRQLQLPES
ncbi:putative Polyadenylate-binding protein and nuclear [Blattamonas nauphoetae]|uniref:Polyadenylate-binding protein and nuclear n=1 Tax=Blattamonas nauphoetae TaxID=2049346 RepID=A0ABQ9X975_9EUKA|nr:putative Polyadenylate-binding protein and nuclear [Blattamonas nauphoetae]